VGPERFVGTELGGQASDVAFVFDSHVDSLQRSLDLGQDLGVRGPGHLDLVRGREGGLGAVVLVLWVDPAYDDGAGGAARRTRALLTQYHQLLERHPDLAHFTGSGADLAAAREQGRVAAICGIEGGHSLEGDLDHLRWYFERGVRVLTLVWNNHLPWIRSCQAGAGSDVPLGLSDFGRDVVREMNRLGMVVDLSHAGRRSFFDALEVGEAPPIASHSGCSALHDHPRNLTDEQLRALAERDGVAGIVFHSGFLDADACAEESRVRALPGYQQLRAELGGANETELFMRQSAFLEAHAAPLALDRVADHVVHAAEVAGIRHVGIGSDYDGIQRGPSGLGDASCYQALGRRLRERGFGEADVAAVMGGNMQRVFAAATGPGALADEATLTRYSGE
jgi:membrane dipeptidase